MRKIADNRGAPNAMRYPHGVKAETKWQVWDGQQYWYAGCFSGTLTWSCPYCGHIQIKRLRKQTWHLKCAECRRTIQFFTTLKPMQANRRVKVTPRDMVMELAPFPIDLPMPPGPAAPVHVLLPADDETP